MKRNLIRSVVGAMLVFGSAACGDTIYEGDTITQVVPPPGPASGNIVALTNPGVLFWVNPTDPGVILGGGAVAGLEAGDTLRSIAYRPATRQLYGYSRFGRLYRIDPAARLATQVGTQIVNLSLRLLFVTAFSPSTDEMRVVTEWQDNVRINPTTSASIVDTALGTTGTTLGIAYTTEVAGGSTLFAINENRLVRIGGVGGTPSPNGGVITNVGPLGLPEPQWAYAGFAITGSGQAYLAMGTAVYFVATLYTVNLETGAATAIGVLGSGGTIRAIAIAP